MKLVKNEKYDSRLVGLAGIGKLDKGDNRRGHCQIAVKIKLTSAAIRHCSC